MGSEKMTRNGLEMAISYFCDIWIETDYIILLYSRRLTNKNLQKWTKIEIFRLFLLYSPQYTQHLIQFYIQPNNVNSRNLK